MLPLSLTARLAPLLAPVLGVLMVLAAAGAGLQTWRLQALQLEVEQERAAKIAAALALAENHRATEAKLNANTRRAADALTTRLQAADAAAADLAGEHRRLLDTLAAGDGRTAEDSAAACRGYADRIGTLERLLGEGAGMVAECAARLVRLDARLTGLQQYVAGIGSVMEGEGADAEAPARER